MIITCEGIIGASKSTQSELLVKRGVCDKYIPEPVKSNPYLEKFYADPKSFAFPMQIFLLKERFKAFQLAQWESLQNPHTKIVADRSYYGDFAFARVQREDGSMDELNFKTYADLHLMFQMHLLFPEVILYLRLTPEQALERIKARSRGCECGITVDYLSSLYRAYEDLMWELDKKTHVKVVDATGSIEEVFEQCKEAVESCEKARCENEAADKYANYMGSFV